MNNLNDLIAYLLKNGTGTALSLTISTCGSKCAERSALKAARSWDYRVGSHWDSHWNRVQRCWDYR
ncbi:hypothetical protein ACQPZP_01880 [Spirillospora sp. CA-142024]|uniref:hypothetical protein n=1 Tax=Spirillospora sp. CA-142024 TaxID=3240036 RepID=UPI003D8EDBB7